MNYIVPSSVKESESAEAGGAAGQAGGAAISEEMSADDEEEMFEGGEEPNVMLEEERIQMCSMKVTCTMRNQWCTETFKDNVPGDCLERFAEYCCGTVTPDAIEVCKTDVLKRSRPEEPDVSVTLECFVQDFVNGDKGKHDACTACCGNKVNDC